MTGSTSFASERLSEGFSDEIKALNTLFDVFRYMKKVTELYGLKSFMVFALPTIATASISRSSIITTWPAELISAYDSQDMLGDSPVLERLRSSTTPFLFDLGVSNTGRETERQKQTFELFERFDLVRGATFPVCDMTGGRGSIGFFGARSLLDHQEMLELHMLCTHIYDRMAQIRSKDERLEEPLAERELDCLNWTAAGKTSAEIAQILGLSEHTVNHYLNKVTRKLGSVNRTHAVAKALRMGLIS
jgi:LuxR family quorum sensing-dependent transcriptional regulator